MNGYRKIVHSVDSGVARIVLNRPEKRNALDAEISAELRGALAVAAGDSETRVVVLSGEGRDFCAGLDLDELRRMQDASVAENLAAARRMADLFLAMRRHPKPIIAAVHGRALGGGCGLATACDLILAAESAQFGYPEVNLGFLPALVATILRRSVSEKRAFELIATGEILSAAAAQAAGLVNQVLPDAMFEPPVKEYALQLASKPAGAVSMAKRLLYQMDGLTFEAALETAVHANVAARMSEECRHGVEKFLGSRKPK